MSFIAFLGCDGSGKSAVISGVSTYLRDQNRKVTLGHWRPQALDQGHQSAAATADDPHGQIPRGTFSSLLKLAWLWLNWWLGWHRFLRRQSHKGVVLFDRYHADLLIDPRRYRYGGPMWLARLASRLMPQPDLVFFLDAEPDVLLSRKQEVSREALEASRSSYRQLAAHHSQFRIIDASQPLADVIAAVCQKITQTR